MRVVVPTPQTWYAESVTVVGRYGDVWEVGTMEGDDGLSVEVFKVGYHVLDVGGGVDEVVVAGEEEEVLLTI